MVDFAELDVIAEEYWRPGGQPAPAFGVVRDGELVHWAGSARVTVRHLLTMTAGFPADDPWADWQQGLPLEDFSALLSGGVSFAWAPDTKFEYASLGYAIFEPDHHGSVGPVVKT
jgi:CubicO group peptidase (beta-lactamase class C family)